MNIKDIYVPNLPKSIVTEFGHELQSSLSKEISDIEDELASIENRKSALYSKHHISLVGQNHALLAEALDMVQGNIFLRQGRLSHVIEDFVEIQLLGHFFSFGNLAPPSLMQPCTDEEYLGAALAASQAMARYSVGQAGENDANSVRICLMLTNQLNQKMLEFDFRNGNLRKKYDGLKYALRRLEDLTYEMSLLGTNGSIPSSLLVRESEDGPPSKKSKVMVVNGNGNGNRHVNGDATSDHEDVATVMVMVPTEELDEMRGRMQDLDRCREEVIKRSRDTQKLSKQAIFAVHRGAMADAASKLKEAKLVITAVAAIVDKEPSLRAGAYSASLEEWAEAELLRQWVTDRRVLTRHDMGGGGGVVINSTEYIGALSDFTGEIGRLAVSRASKRDFQFVRQVFETDVVISVSVMKCDVGGGFSRKIAAININLKKVEEIVYELSILQRGGRIREDKDKEDVNVAVSAGRDVHDENE
eukprot:gene10026-20875_t